jgi:hypothetical protein
MFTLWPLLFKLVLVALQLFTMSNSFEIEVSGFQSLQAQWVFKFTIWGHKLSLLSRSFFHLWGQGGPNWIAEEKKFYKEQKE